MAEQLDDAPDNTDASDEVRLIDALVDYLRDRTLLSRKEQADALSLGSSGNVAVSRYLRTGRDMSLSVVRRAVRELNVGLTYDGYRWQVIPLDELEPSAQPDDAAAPST